MEKTQYVCRGEDTTGLKLDNNELIVTCENYNYSIGIHFNNEDTDENPLVKYYGARI